MFGIPKLLGALADAQEERETEQDRLECISVPHYLSGLISQVEKGREITPDNQALLNLMIRDAINLKEALEGLPEGKQIELDFLGETEYYSIVTVELVNGYPKLTIKNFE